MSKTGKRIPINWAKKIAEDLGYTQVIIHGYDGETGIQHVTTFGKSIEDGEFCLKLKNAFSHFMGKDAEEVLIRFRGSSIKYIQESLFHNSQKIEMEDSGAMLYTVCVAEPKEVLWWCLQFGEEAEILKPVYLRAMASNISEKMHNMYSKKYANT